MFREWPLGHEGSREEAGDAFRVHDERTHAETGIFIRLVVGNVRTGPGGPVPGDELAVRVEWLAAGIAGGSVVHHAAIGRPGVSPVERLADSRRVRVVPTSHQVAGRSP